jgi:nucleotide-binding universal stress UspA family protein
MMEVGCVRAYYCPLAGSMLAECALPAAVELTRLMGTPLHLLREVDPSQLDLAGYGTYESALAQGASSPFLTDEGAAANADLERMSAREIEQGLGTSSEVQYSGAAREIVAMAQPRDLIVMGTHGRRARTCGTVPDSTAAGWDRIPGAAR